MRDLYLSGTPWYSRRSTCEATHKQYLVSPPVETLVLGTHRADGLEESHQHPWCCQAAKWLHVLSLHKECNCGTLHGAG